MAEEISPQPIEIKTQTPEPTKDKKWYKTWWGIIFLILIWPVTLIWLVWTKTKWKTIYKGLATGGIVLFFIIILASMGGSGTNNTTNVSSNSKPNLTVTSPDKNMTVQKSEIEIKGKLEPTISNLYINDEGVRYNDDGTFNKTISLEEGKNVIKIKATNSSGTTEVTREITRELTTEEKAKIEFDIPSLLSKNIDELRNILGQPIDGEFIEPTAEQQALMKEESWDNTFKNANGKDLLVSFNHSTRKVTEFFIGTDDPSGKTQDKKHLLEMGHLKESDSRYKVEFVKALKDPSFYTGVKAIPNN